VDGKGTKWRINIAENLNWLSREHERYSPILLLLAFNAPTEGFSWDDLHKVLHGDQRMPRVQNGVKIA